MDGREPQAAPEKEWRNREEKKVWSDMHMTGGGDTCSPAPSLVPPAAPARRSEGCQAESSLPICGESVHLIGSMALLSAPTAHKTQRAGLQAVTSQAQTKSSNFLFAIKQLCFGCFSLFNSFTGYACSWFLFMANP